MSTPNFSYENVLFATDVDDEFILDDTIDNVFYELENIFGDKINKADFESQFSCRSYYRKVFAVIDLPRIDLVNDGQIDSELRLTVTGGYYVGANFDYELYIDSTEYDDDDNADCIADTLKSIDEYEFTDDANKKLEALYDDARAKVENAYKSYLTPLNCVGIFSNGEAIYEKANN